MYVDGEPERTCPRFFGSAIDRVEVVEIEVSWEGHMRLSIRVPENRVHWGMRLASDAATRGIGSVGRALPRFVRESPWALSALGRLAGPILGVGQLSLAGTSPNGQEFRAGPRNLFRVEAAAAVVEGRDLGALGPLAEQARLGDLWLPNGGVFATGEAAFETFNSARHSRAVTRWSRNYRPGTSPGAAVDGEESVGNDPDASWEADRGKVEGSYALGERIAGGPQDSSP